MIKEAINSLNVVGDPAKEWRFGNMLPDCADRNHFRTLLLYLLIPLFSISFLFNLGSNAWDFFHKG
jgi:hypothetical protein